MSGGEPNTYSINEWIEKIQAGKVQVPDFQRDFVWDSKRAVVLIEAILKDRPVGSLLGLHVGPETGGVPFQPRPLDNAPNPGSQGCQLLVLDGQQRLTALWHALKNKSDKFLYLFEYPGREGSVFSAGRAERKPVNGTPKWINDCKECFQKGYVPMYLLAETSETIREWAICALGNEGEVGNLRELTKLEDWIKEKSRQVLSFKIPYLSLPQHTSESDAIEAFVESNTSAQNLRKFDLTVATMRLSFGVKDNLRNLRDDTGDAEPRLLRYANEDELGDLLLKVACLRKDLPPTEGNYGRKEVLKEIQENIQEIRKGCLFPTSVALDTPPCSG